MQNLTHNTVFNITMLSNLNLIPPENIWNVFSVSESPSLFQGLVQGPSTIHSAKPFLTSFGGHISFPLNPKSFDLHTHGAPVMKL